MKYLFSQKLNSQIKRNRDKYKIFANMGDVFVDTATKQNQLAPKSKLAAFISAQIALSEKTQREIARELGYAKPNVITMIKQGEMKLPIEKVAPLAQALEIDAVRLLSMTMEEYMPETWQVIEEINGFSVTENEREIIEILRKETGGSDPHIAAVDQRVLLEKFAKSLMC